MSLDEIEDFYANSVFPRLPKIPQSFIRSDEDLDDFEMMIDDYLQFSLIHSVDIPIAVLDATEDMVRAGWDVELVERTLGWIVKHREKSAAA